MVLFEKSDVNPDVAGWAPTDFQTRYNLPFRSKGAGQIVAIVDAYDNPDARTDLNEYRSYFGLGTATFQKFNQYGKTSSFPAPNKGWGLEEALDIEMVSAVCPKCTIYLVEANSNGTADLGTAEQTAVALGAHIISNSWGCGGTPYCVDPSEFDTKGVLYVAAAGDSGYPQEWEPAALPGVVSVGGTELSKSGSTYSETTWPGTGSGCASGITKPLWQHDSGCPNRTQNDVSAVAADVAEYDSYDYGGWITVHGTSIATPLIAGVYALAGNATTLDGARKLYVQTAAEYAADMHDITTGNNGSCGGSYLCTARKGYDGPTGWGTPNTTKAF
jgi:subtilase family serine protease